MGALTSNRKRGEDYCSPYYKTPAVTSSNFDHVTKKPRYSPPAHQVADQRSSSSSIFSRVFLYPEAKAGFHREVHAPHRAQRFRKSIGTISNKREPREMGNALAIRYEKTKRAALHGVRYVTSNVHAFLDKVKEVIDADTDTDTDTVVEEDEDVSKDSSMEEDEVLENGNERKMGLSVLSEQKSKETNDRNVKFHPSSSSVVSDMGDLNLKVDTAGKMMNKLSLFQDLDSAPREPMYKRLLNSAQKRNGRLHSLNWWIAVNEQRYETIRLMQTSKRADEDVANELFVPLTEEEETEVACALSSSRRMVLVTHKNSNIEITGEKLQCLRPGAWLNDEVINLYLELLKEREKQDPKKFLKCHYFSTFFYEKLIGSGGYSYKAVRRWTTKSKLGYCLMECDKIFVPIHKAVHWCLAVINKKDKKFQYLDSLGGIDTQVMNALARYIVDEVRDKNRTDIDISSWKQEYVEDLPTQENGFDCGMFMIKYADFYSRDIGLCFNQEHMPYFRLRTAKEILRLKAE